jgi:hypothetical protein
MATIIDFQELTRQKSRTSGALNAHGPAQLLLFTGIRYERADIAECANPAKPPRGRKRKTAYSND